MCTLSRGRNMNRQNSRIALQREYLESLDGKLVTIIMVNGYQLKCYINDIDDSVVIITRPGPTIEQDVQCMIFKHAISTIEPAK